MQMIVNQWLQELIMREKPETQDLRFWKIYWIFLWLRKQLKRWVVITWLLFWSNLCENDHSNEYRSYNQIDSDHSRECLIDSKRLSLLKMEIKTLRLVNGLPISPFSMSKNLKSISRSQMKSNKTLKISSV